MTRPRLMIAAGEASGDRLGAALVTDLRQRIPQLRVTGLVGPALRDVGVVGVADAEDVTALGLAEALRVLPTAARVLRRLRSQLVRWKPDVLVTVDSPDLMLRLGRLARAVGVPVIHWVSPQLWAWRPGRVRRIARSADTVMCLLPFEPALYAGRVRAVFTGHPAAATRPRPTAPVHGAPVIALCPGSRPSEVRRLWPVLRAVATEVRRRHPDAGFVVPVAATVDERWLGGLACQRVSHLAEVGSVADAAVVASGTATLELAALGVPQVVVGRVHPLTAAVVRRLATTRHVALPNVLAGRAIVPEHLQQLQPHRIAADLDRVRRAEGPQVPRRLLDRLAGDTAIERAADEVSRWLP